MRPRFRSYGESSTATLSPDRMRMKFLRILPETCARTLCLFSSSTRNMALGNGSMTVPITSMASSLELPESSFFLSFGSSTRRFAICSCFYSLARLAQPAAPLQRLSLHRLRAALDGSPGLPGWPGHFFRPGQDPGPVGGYSDGVLEVSGRAAIGRLRHPLVAHPYFRAAGIDHRLHSDDHAFLQPSAASCFAVIRQIRLVVHLGTDAMPDELAHHRKTVRFHQALYCVANIAEPVARAHLIDGAVERIAGDIQQLLHFRPNVPDRHSDRRIRVIPVHFHPEIDRNDLAFAQFALGRRDAVNDLAVHRGAEHARITAIPFERRMAWLAGDFFLGELLEVHRRQSGAHKTAQRRQNFVHEQASAVHLFQLIRASEMYRHLPFSQPGTWPGYLAPRTISSTCLVTSPTLFEASTSCKRPSRL